MNMKSWTTVILWGVYICLLAVLVPHTAWGFEKMEMPGTRITHWAAAIAFEAAIAVLTHKLAKHMETTGRIKGWWKKVSARYLNPIALGLLAATVVSALANLAHAVEFGQPLKIFTEWGVPQGVYSLAFGGVLPFVSLIFARVLSNVVDTEQEEDPELVQANTTIRSLRDTIRQTEQRAKVAEQQHQEAIRLIEHQANEAEQRHQEAIRLIEQQYSVTIRDTERRLEESEQRYRAVGDVVRFLFGTDLALRERIRGVRTTFPNLSQNGIAQLLGCSVSTVSEALNGYVVELPDLIEVQP